VPDVLLLEASARRTLDAGERGYRFAMEAVEVFADVACPFTHASLRRFVAVRDDLGRDGPLLRVRAWPLEFVNGEGLAGSSLDPKIEALQDGPAPDLFRAFDPDTFPTTSLPALVVEAAAYRAGDAVGEAFGLAVRTALFEEGADVSDPEVLDQLRQAHGVPLPTPDDERQVRADYEDGRRRGVKGSPHFFTSESDFFCPSVEIRHDDGGIQVSFDSEGFSAFTAAVFG
jgi:predicted DsbA family dithiol-disulfide isomerase